MDDVEGVDDDLEIGQIQNARSFNKFQDLIVALASAALSAALVTRGGASSNVPYGSDSASGNKAG